ncbi:xanthine dehydrogenase family protein molybdopterin-binding subunit [Rhodoplanes sp. Z2-YC6860]|uniref:xanthine dehydrogenase family protein molybdopterin-binding subunit n=1 Tax=Rhodoplanes sp. Z2-YC6860 TaxID=674703 RepID=UPI00078EE83D|nr:xanthine dehydrogenase family protein molybdopterin-binding subunit [Rhodoplanes sp. Z2-YC6860]AMN44491.1 carbon monoxide dehydrogenase [Rhodoplanes sp. Z2-YC6860]
MGQFSIGQSVRRREDPRLLRGRGRYYDDLKLADQLHAAILRSPHAHADIRGIDVRAALQMPGVHAVLTGRDYEADKLGTMPTMAPYKKRDGGPMYLPHRPAIAISRAMHVGYPVAVVVADTLDQARDAAERVEVDYAPRPAVVNARDAFQPGAPQLYDDCPNNEAYFYQAGNKAAVDEAFARAAHVVEQHLVINRVTANTMEPRGVTGEYDSGTGRYTVQFGFQRPWLFRNAIAETTLKISESQLRLITGDIGGSYGLRGSVYPEIILMLWAARRVGRPVKWLATRNEAHISDDDARDNIVDAALALDRDGKFLAVRIRSFGNLGAFVSFRGALPPVVNIGTVCGVYTTPAAHVAISGMLTNTHCTSPYRGAGRPEASYMIERLIDIAADEMKIDPAELRRRNTIPPQAMPYKTPLTFTYDSGRFEENMDRAMKLGDWTGFEARRKESARRGLLRGIGISNTIEQAADPTYETAEIRFDPLGGMTFVTGSISHGQGHATIQTQILVDRLGVDPDAIKFVQGDTEAVAFGMGTGGSRSTTMSGGAIVMVADKIISKAKKLAAHLLEASEGDMEFKDGRFGIAGTDRGIGIHDVAKAAFKVDKLPPGMEPGLYETATYRATSGNFPNGAHVCEVEIDPETGVTDVVRYSVVDDVGTVINPMLVKGQIMGGIAQGLGQVLMEDKAYDPQTGQVISGSFMDYAMPRAEDFCLLVVEDNPVPTPTNPLGVKGAGEAGTVGSLSAGVNAIVDALSGFGIRHIDTPCTPFRVWQAIQEAKRGS